jgi:endo-1,4-beta-D-glucanase Y
MRWANTKKWWLIAIGIGLLIVVSAAQGNVIDQLRQLLGQNEWSQWESFREAFVSKDGRVVDHSEADLRTVSEGQGYAMFFALVANDRTTFNKLATWTENNLSQGDLTKRLPAWIWAKHGNEWGVTDTNSAADADLWIAYALLEASKQWCNKPYEVKAKALAERILNEETLEIEGLGLTLLPGKQGFVNSDGSVKLNPSYVPPFILAQFANHWASDPRWANVYLASQRLLIQSANKGSYSDWLLFRNGQPERLATDTKGDFDAIRAYLWLGMTAKTDPTRATLARLQRPFLEETTKKGAVPLWAEPSTQSFSQEAGPPGFQAALVPLADTEGMQTLADTLIKKTIQSESPQAWLNYGYYNSVLTLFGKGHHEKRYSFNAQGELQLSSKGPARCE